MAEARHYVKTTIIVSLLYFSAFLDCIALILFLNDVCCMKKQISLSCDTIAGHSIQLDPGDSFPYNLLYTDWSLPSFKNFQSFRSQDHTLATTPIRRITEYSVKLAPNIRIDIVFHLDSPNLNRF